MKVQSLITAALVLLLAAPAGADQAQLPLGSLVQGADTIVLGVVSAATPGTRGHVLMTVDVAETLKGATRDSIQVLGSSLDATLPPPAAPGTKVLVFLANGSPIPVGREGGMNVLLGDGSVRFAREVVKSALGRGKSLRLADVAPHLGSREAHPALMTALLEELTATVTPQEAALVTSIACDSSAAFHRQARLWAIGQAGRMKIAAARPCLEKTVGDPTNIDARIAATEALGEMKNPASVPALLPLIQPLPGHRTSDSKGDGDPLPPVGRNEDPEDGSAPVSDPGERADPAPNDAEPRPVPSSDRDGETQLDNGPTDDVMRRGAEAGLADAAVLALGKIGDERAIQHLFRLAREGDDLALHSSVVNALGLIGGPRVHGPLTSIGQTHPNELVRELARQTLARLQSTRR